MKTYSVGGAIGNLGLGFAAASSSSRRPGIPPLSGAQNHQKSLSGYASQDFSYPSGLMLRLAWFFAVAFLSHAVLTAQVADSSSPEPPRYDRGVIANGTYTNDCLGFSLALPEGWEASNPAAKAPGVAIHAGGALWLLTLNRQTGSVLGESILLLAVDTSPSFALTSEQFVTQFVQRTINIDPRRRELIRAAHTVDYGGKQFYRADYEQSSDKGGAMYLGHIYTKFRAHLIGITLIASSPEALDESAKVLEKIAFRDDQPNPACVPGTNDGLQPGTAFGVLGSVAPTGSVKPGSRVRVSSGVSSGLLVKRVEPQYPEAARKGRIAGTIILSASISELGNVESVELVSGDRTLAPAAIEAVKQWKYKPFLLNGTPMTMVTQVVVDFKLPAN